MADDARASERWPRVEELFHAASALPIAARESYLSAQTADDPSLKDEVLDLLGSDSSVSDLMATPVVLEGNHLVREASTDAWVGRILDGFRIDALLGRGGMGVVYAGTRVEGILSQRVAIKLIAQQLQSTPAQSQFLLERNTLAALEHPHIAKLVGGGMTDQKLPFVAMEYIDGRRLDVAADDPSVTLEEIVRWMLQLCDAVSYVHRNLILHRDLKPGNVMVTADGTVKLLDFGTLKVIGSAAVQDSGMTQAGMRPVTLRYASPEHIRGEAGSTALDVYSLGMTLYRLLAGKLPENADESVQDYLHWLNDGTIPPPSKWTDARRRLAGSGLATATELAADLDAITLQAIRPRAEDRYESADALAADLRRALESKPVAARAGTIRYRMNRFTRRNQTLVAGTAVACIVLVAGLIGVRHEANVAHAQSRRATAGVEEERKLVHLLLTDYFTQIREVPGSTHAQTVAVARAVSYLDQLNRTATDANLQLESLRAYRTLGSLLGSPYEANLGDAPAAIKTLEQGQPLIEKLLARNGHSLDYLTAAAGLETAFGQVYLGQGDGQHALSHLLAAGAFIRRVADDPRATSKMMIQAAAVYKTLADTYGEHGDATTRDPAKDVASLQQSSLYYQRALLLQPHCCERGLIIVQTTLSELLEDIDANQALTSYQQSLAVIASLAPAQQSSIGFVRLTGTLRMHLGTDYLILLRRTQGEALLLPEFQRERGAIAADPVDTRARTDLIDLDSTALDGYEALEDTAMREALLKEELDHLRFLTHGHPDNLVWQSQQTSGQLRLAAVLLQQNRIAEARAMSSKALPIAVSAARDSRADAAALQTAADFLVTFHIYETKGGDEALVFAQRLVAMDTNPSASHLLTLAAAQQGAGDAAQASATATKALHEIQAHPRGVRYAMQLEQAKTILKSR